MRIVSSLPVSAGVTDPDPASPPQVLNPAHLFRVPARPEREADTSTVGGLFALDAASGTVSFDLYFVDDETIDLEDSSTFPTAKLYLTSEANAALDAGETVTRALRPGIMYVRITANTVGTNGTLKIGGLS